MTKVFRVDFNVSHYQFFTPYEEDIQPSGLLDMGCKSIAQRWNPPHVRWQRYDGKQRLRRGDFLHIITGTLVAAPKTMLNVSAFFEAAGEVLPLPFEEITYSLLHITQCVDCLDEERSTWRSTPEGIRFGLEEYVFHPESLGASSLFKIPQQPRGSLLTFERTRQPCEEFKAYVEAEGLTGLEFYLLWSDE
jgi:hypothetical protein